jgi:hypothetical protein
MAVNFIDYFILSKICRIRDFRLRPHADEVCAFLGCNAASSGNPLPTFRDNVSVQSSRVKKSTILLGLTDL